MIHQQRCPYKDHPHNEGQRVSDTYNLHMLADRYNAIGKWFAAALKDGRSDNVLYDSKYDAVIHQKNNEKYYTFIKIGPASMHACEGQIMLNTARRLYKAGIRMADPDHRAGGFDLVKRLTWEDQLNQMRGAVTNLRMPWETE